MEINPNSHTIWSPTVGTVPKTRPTAEVRQDNAAFEETAKLRQALNNVPEVRPAVVARAKALLGDVNYPPMETIQKIGELLAVHFNESVESAGSWEP